MAETGRRRKKGNRSPAGRSFGRRRASRRWAMAGIARRPPTRSFGIGRGYEPGILRVDWAGDADFILPLRLYYDTGEGFTENGFNVGRAGRGSQKRALLPPPEKRASQLRLDPGEGTGDFILTAFFGDAPRPAEAGSATQ